MLRLFAPVDTAYRLAVKAAPTDTILLNLTEPDATVSLLNPVLAGDTHVVNITPTQLGTHTIEVTGTADPDLLNQQFELDVTQDAHGSYIFDPTNTDPASGLPTGARIRWPCPNFAALPCIGGWSEPAVNRWLNVATSTLFADTCGRFPGVHNYAKLRPRPSTSCLRPVGSTFGIDLWPEVRYPILELIDIELNGASIGPAGWRIEEQRYLVPNAGTLWPNQDFAQPDGGAGTWAAIVRFGRFPPPLAVTARDRFMYSMIVDNEPTLGGSMACALPEGTTQLFENNRTISISPDHGSASAALVEEARRRWRCRSRGPRMFDPAETHVIGGDFAPVVAGDPTPTYTHAAFLASGCDLGALLAEL